MEHYNYRYTFNDIYNLQKLSTAIYIMHKTTNCN